MAMKSDWKEKENYLKIRVPKELLLLIVRSVYPHFTSSVLTLGASAAVSLFWPGTLFQNAVEMKGPLAA